jgi:DNA-binding response OmpR family regulator
MTATGPGKLAGRRILVVEDEYFIADDLSRGLRREGARVVGPAADLAGALKLGRGEQLDGAVLDVNLGGEMSYPVADLLAHRGVPYLFTTGYDDRTLIGAYSDVARIEKPFDVEAVMTALAHLLRESGMREEPA